MKPLFILTLFTLVLAQLKAQSPKNRKDSTVVVIFNENKDANGNSKSKKTGESNIVKIAPLGFISGTFPLYFERRINNFLTVQVGGGLTSRNYVRGIIQKESSISEIAEYPWGENSQFNDAAEPFFGFKKRKPAMGYMFSIQPRLYFESDAPDGSFLAISYDYYHYATTIAGLKVNSNNEVVHTGENKSEYENLSDIMVHFGYQYIYDRLTLEYTTGIGLRNSKGSKYAANFDYNTNSVNNEGFASYQQTAFNFSIGLKVGYHF